MEEINFVGINDSEKLFVANSQYRILISGRQTGRKYAVIEMNVPAGAGPMLHAHKDIEEVFYVAGGEVEFRTEKGKYTAKAGDTVRIPLGGVIHAFKNVSKSDAKLICTVFPAGLDEMFKEVNSAGPSQARAIGEKYGNQFYPVDFFDKA